MKKIYIHYICLKLLFINITAVNLFAQAPTDNLVAHFDFESITNNNISAASGTGSANVGTLNNVTPVTENGNTFLDFDSSNTPSYVRFDQSNSDEFRFAEDYTLSMALWLKPTLLNAGDQVLLSINKDDGSTRHYIELRGSNTFNVFFNTKDYEGTDSWQSAFLAADLQGSFLTNDDMNNWIHFAFTYDGTDIKLYINGSLVREKTLTVARQNTGLVHFNDAALHFGGVWGETPGTISEAFTGSIDDVYLYEDALTATEVANLYTGSTTVYSSNTSISSDETLDSVTINSGVTLTIDSNASLTINNQLENNGSIVMNSASNEYSSLIASSVSGSGSFTYNRYVSNTSTFDIISAPFSSQTFSNLLSNNSGVIYDNPSDATQYAYGPFNNDSGAYVQYDSDTDGNQTMDAGLGFRTGRLNSDNGTTLAFTGTFETSNVTEPITLGSDATYARWNLIGNPFPSYLDLNHFFTDNSNILDTNYAAIYTYDGDDSNGSVWTTYNGNNSSGQYIAPGQAFFVAASGSANISFDTDMQSTAGTDDFLPGERRPNDDSFGQNTSSSNSKISLALSFDDSKYAATDIYLNTKASSGLDVGYDAGTFANQAGSLGLYSFLADGSHPETKLAIQAVSNNISDPVVIPLGVNAQSGIDYTIKLKERPQQEGVFVYLKDKLDNSMTLLTDEDYNFNTSTDLQGDGRFEVHLSAFALSTFDISKAPYSMIGLRGKVQVTGELSKGDVITILDLRGRTLAKQTVNSPTQSATVQLNGVSKGVYIGKVENNIGQYNTKFILK